MFTNWTEERKLVLEEKIRREKTIARQCSKNPNYNLDWYDLHKDEATDAGKNIYTTLKARVTKQHNDSIKKYDDQEMKIHGRN